jgi:hypothetical protein
MQRVGRPRDPALPPAGPNVPSYLLLVVFERDS